MEILNDFNTSVEKALSEIDERWQDYDGLIVCGTHTPHDIEMMIDKIREARETGRPFLGICFGFQLCLIEFARSELGLKDANSTEINPKTPYPIFTKLPELRVGIFPVAGEPESHWHNYAFNREYEKLFTDKGWQFVFTGDILEIARYGRYMMSSQYHGEYQSSRTKPHKDLANFLKYAKRVFKQDGVAVSS